MALLSNEKIYLMILQGKPVLKEKGERKSMDIVYLESFAEDNFYYQPIRTLF